MGGRERLGERGREGGRSERVCGRRSGREGGAAYDIEGTASFSHQRARDAFASKLGTSQITACVGVTHVTFVRSRWKVVQTACERLSVPLSRHEKTLVL